MLLEKLHILLVKAEAKKKHNVGGKRKIDIQRMNSELGEIKSKSGAILSYNLLFKDDPNPDIYAKVNKLEKILGSEKSVILVDPERFKESEKFRDFLADSEKLLTEINRLSKEKWKEICSKGYLNDSQITQLDIFEKIPKYTPLITDLKRNLNNYDRVSLNLPVTKSHILDAEKLKKEIMIKYDDLGLERNPEIGEFLKASQTPGGASLDLLTGEVKIWLKENDVAGNYGIKPHRN